MGLFRGNRDRAREQPAGNPGRRRPLLSDEVVQRPQAFSYYSKRSGTTHGSGRQPLDPDMVRAETTEVDRPWWQHRFVVTTGALLVIGLLGWMLNLGADPKVVPITRGGNAYFLQNIQVYQQTAVRQLEESLLNRNKLTLNATGLSSELEEQYPEIARATVSVPIIGKQPTVYIEPTRPSFILTTTDSGAYLLDETGRALVSTSQITDPGELSVPNIQDTSGVRVDLGKQALPSSTVTFAETFLGYLKASGVQYNILTLPEAASELQVTIKGAKYYVRCNLMGDARLQAGTFLAAKGRLDKDKVRPTQYVDVRVPERAYYR